MKQERVILSFIAVLIGLLVAGVAFYFYQSTKVVQDTKVAITNQIQPTPTPKPTIYLSVTNPEPETVVNNKTLQILGSTNPEASVIIITSSDQEVLQPSTTGNFSTTIILDSGENLINIESILPDGEQTTVLRTVTYSTEDF